MRPEFAPWLGVFETLRVIDGKPLFLAEHREELHRAMEALGLTSDLDLAAEAAKLPRKSGRWRWIVVPGRSEGLFSEEPLPSSQPVTLTVSPVRVGSCNWDARFKTISYLSHAQAAKLAGDREAVLLNEHGQVASAARGNIFWVRGGELFTPAHEAGCRQGVVRRLVLERTKVVEGSFPLEDLHKADEIFVTGSMRGIVSVNRLEGRAEMHTAWADRLRKAYDELVVGILAGSGLSSGELEKK